MGVPVEVDSSRGVRGRRRRTTRTWDVVMGRILIDLDNSK
jgi:hypothetical protein